MGVAPVGIMLLVVVGSSPAAVACMAPGLAIRGMVGSSMSERVAAVVVTDTLDAVAPNGLSRAKTFW